MRVLYVGNAMGLENAGQFYFIPQKLINGFIRAGHAVTVFNDRDQARFATPFRRRKLGATAANRKLLEAAEAFRPELIVLGHCEAIGNRTVAELQAMTPKPKVVYRNVDSLVQHGNIEKIKRRAEIVDGIFLTTAGGATRQFETATCFVAFMPNPVDGSIDRGKSFEQATHDADIFFAGGAIDDMQDSRRAELQQITARLSDLRLKILGSAAGQPPLFGQAYLDALVRCRMGLSLDRSDRDRLYASDRMAQYLGNGLLTFLRRGKGFEEFFGQDEVVFFEGVEDLAESARRYVADDEAWRAVARKGWEKAHLLYDSTRVARYIVERSFAQPFSEDYPWHAP